MSVVVEVPRSKSFAQRAMIVASLAPGPSRLTHAADCDDTRLLARALAALGVGVSWRGDTIEVRGGGRLAPPGEPLFIGNNGTGLRFLTALAALADAPTTIDGVEALRRRPMPGLLAALAALGVETTCAGRPQCPPVTIGGGLRAGGRVAIDPTGSSQQVSALLNVGHRLSGGLELELTSTLPSRPYVEMTLEVLAAFGADARWVGDDALTVAEGQLQPTTFDIEPDYSAAAMILAGGWIAGREVSIPGLNERSSQGDRVFAGVLERIASGTSRTIDLGDAPDVVPPAVAAALFAEGPTRIENVGHLRIKECDRLAVLSGELGKLGARIEVEPDALVVRPAPLRAGPPLDPAGDHRMAMAFGLVGLRVPGVVVADPECVSKSFPGFWSALERLR